MCDEETQVKIEQKRIQTLNSINELKKELENEPQYDSIKSHLKRLEKLIDKENFTETICDSDKQVGVMAFNSSNLRNWLAIAGIVLGLIIGGVRLFDSVSVALVAIERIEKQQEQEKNERIAGDLKLKELIQFNNEVSTQQYSQIQVKLMELDTHLVYIRQALEKK